MTDAAMALPAQVSMRSAASAPKGNAPPGWQMAFEYVSILLLPLAVPNLALWIVRGELGLVEICFGFVAVAAAVLTKAVSVKTTAWAVVAIVALILTVTLVTIAIGTDPWRPVAEIISLSSGSEREVSLHAPQIVEASSDLKEESASVGHWIAATAMGIVLISVTAYLIRKGDA